MSLAVASAELDSPPPTRAGIPVVPHWTLPRSALHRLLDRGAEGVLTVVSAPAGSGKTLGVASWAAGPTSPSGVVWVNLPRGGADPDLTWKLVRRALLRAGEQHLPPLPIRAAGGPDRIHALAELGAALSDRCPWTVVLDGFPTGRPTQLGAELEVVLEHAGRSLRVVLLCQGDPALDLHRFEAAGELVRVTPADLLMDDAEIAGVLRLGNSAYDDATIAAVATRTFGWACGVRRAAVARETTTDWSSALEETERAIEDYLAHEVLGGLTAPVRRFLVWTSVVEVVSPGLVRAGLGTGCDAEIDRTIAETGLVQRFQDGSLACHPLLRAAARARLAEESTEESTEESPDAHQAVVRWFAEHEAPEAAVALCLAARDWTQAAEVLVQTHAVPRLVAGTADQAVLGAAGLPEVQAAEPLIHAALAAARGDAMAAEVALATAMTPDPALGTRARPLATAFVQLGIARISGRSVGADGLVPRTRGLLAEASVAALDGLIDLVAALDAFAGAEELASGDHDRAAVTLARGADRASMDCAGQLAVLEAFRGDLGEASRRAQGVLLAGPDRTKVGVAHARIALAWVAVDRGNLAEAQARLDEATDAWPGIVEPWLLRARQVIHARLLIASGRPDEALRLGLLRSRESLGQSSAWFAGQAACVSAEALLATGEPQQALGVVTLGLPTGSPERAVLTAIACRDIGDARGAAAAIASTATDLHRASRATQLQGWVLEARLALDRGQVDRATTLVARALRSASAEGLRRPLVADGPWLRWFLDRDGSALRDLRPFAQSLVGHGGAAPAKSRPVPATPGETVLEQLTERETQVLELLAQMCSTDEIAAELFVSANTVKTHLKGIFRKYSVNRRVDAVRRGRELGLC